MKKILIFLTLSVLIFSCANNNKELKENNMIKPSIFNAINFSSDFNRESDQFDPFLQRKKSVVSNPSSSCYLSFYYKPDEMPETMPNAYMTTVTDTGDDVVLLQSASIELDSGYIYFFLLDSSERGTYRYSYVKISGLEEIVYSENYDFIDSDDIADNNIIELIAHNDDNIHGYISDYPACGFFKVSELNGDVFGNEKVEYEYSYGRKKILSSENYIKKRYTFVDLTMYQQNLLKTLCNCENLKINGTLHYLVSDFTEVGKDTNNEIFSLQADFIPVEQSFFATGADEVPSKLTPENLFIQ